MLSLSPTLGVNLDALAQVRVTERAAVHLWWENQLGLAAAFIISERL